jgi:hypothetical protein
MWPVETGAVWGSLHVCGLVAEVLLAYLCRSFAVVLVGLIPGGTV